MARRPRPTTKRLFKGQQKRAAEIFHAETIAALSRGQYIDVTDKTTVTEYARQWVSIQPYRPSSRERRESQIRTHLEPARLGQMRLVKVRHSDVQAFATDLDRRRAAETVRGVMRLVAAVFASAARDQLIGHSPAQRIVLSPPPVEPVVPLTVEQVASLRRAMPDRMHAMGLAQAGLGLRVGELLALRVSDVDFRRREVTSASSSTLGHVERMPLKTPSSRRTLPLPQMVAEALGGPPCRVRSQRRGLRVHERPQSGVPGAHLPVPATCPGAPGRPAAGDLARPAPQLRLLASARRRVRGHRRRPARAQGREQGDLHLRTPRAGDRGPRPVEPSTPPGVP